VACDDLAAEQSRISQPALNGKQERGVQKPWQREEILNSVVIILAIKR
jgi:hypothetical protein